MSSSSIEHEAVKFRPDMGELITSHHVVDFREQDSLLGCMGMGHRDDDISLFVSCFDIPVGFGSLF